jgi:hypothetical protein
MLLINDIYFQGLLDTGADVSIISLDQWPSQWSMTEIKATFSGIGQITDIWQCTEVKLCIGPEGQKGEIKSYITDIVINLWRRDLLAEWGASLNIPTLNSSVKIMMARMEYNNKKG